MSYGITLHCPSCGEFSALKKEKDFLPVKLKVGEIRHPNDWYDSNIPVYTCQKCEKQFAIERVNK